MSSTLLALPARAVRFIFAITIRGHRRSLSSTTHTNGSTTCCRQGCRLRSSAGRSGPAELTSRRPHQVRRKPLSSRSRPGSEEACILGHLKTAARSAPALDFSRSRYPAIFLQSVEVAFRKTIQYQLLTRTVLNPGSRKVWRETGREREFRAPTRSAQCGGFAANACRYWRFERAEKRAEKVGHGWSGGGRGTGMQRSPKLECPKAHMRVRLGSNSFAEITKEIQSPSVRISLA